MFYSKVDEGADKPVGVGGSVGVVAKGNNVVGRSKVDEGAVKPVDVATVVIAFAVSMATGVVAERIGVAVVSVSSEGVEREVLWGLLLLVIVIVVVLKGTDVDVGGVRSENDLALYEVLVLIWLL